MKWMPLVLLLALFPSGAAGQIIHLQAGAAFLHGSGDFDDEFASGYTLRAGGQLKLSKRFDLLLSAQYAWFPATVESYDRHEIRSYHPFSEWVHYRAAGGNFAARAGTAHLRFTPLPAIAVQPYVQIGLGLGQNIYGKRTTDPPGSVFEREHSAAGSLVGSIGMGCKIPLSERVALSVEGSRIGSSELFFSRDYYTLALGMEYRIWR